MLVLLVLMWTFAQGDVTLPTWLAGVVAVTPASVLLLLWWRVSQLERHLGTFRSEHREDLGKVWGAIERLRGGS